MSYLFFSYSRSDTGNAFLTQFYKDLATEVRQKLGTFPSSSADREIIYLDTTEPVGQNWEQDLVTSLQGCKALVCVYSPSYFNSHYCGQEFAVFQSRLIASNPQNPPPLMFPVLWDMNERVRTAIGSNVSGIQYTHDKFAKEYEQEGLCYLMRRHKSEYQAFLHHFAKMMTDAIEKQKVAVPPLPVFPDLKAVASAWKSADGPLTKVAPQVTVGGAGTTQFFFVAGAGADYANVRQHVDCYNVHGGRFWAPYHPDVNHQVQFISLKAADEAKANYEDLPVTATLVQQIEAAEKANTVVLLVVDPWSVKIQTLRDLLEACANTAYVNCGIVVPWNIQDGEPAAEHSKLRQELGLAFKRIHTVKHMYFRDCVASAPDLESELSKAILEIRSRLMQWAKEVRAAEPSDAEAESRTSLPVIHASVGGAS